MMDLKVNFLQTKEFTLYFQCFRVLYLRSLAAGFCALLNRSQIRAPAIMRALLRKMV